MSLAARSGASGDLCRLDLVERDDRLFAFVTLNRPERTNALVPELVAALADAIRQAGSANVSALVLAGEGRFFSSGGDVGAFHAALDGDIHAYAEAVVGGLQDLVLSLLAFPVPVIARIQGGVTGGAAGLMLAADLVALDHQAFIQPYYSMVGFAPDGGWTALLPERIGPARAASIQFLNRRIAAEEARSLGLADRIGPVEALDGIVDEWLASIASKSRLSLMATRKLIWDERRLETVRDRLAAEKQAFLDLIGRQETKEGMRRFLRRD
ncbi:MAG: hypothetical protein RLZZ444_2689 [Pseudomonadota bacterium]|jgi:2-(1,2-epoxy-1,2-dihydrophenyl)acetyl-CoA isomerase